jgi:hypothetical protein
MALVARAVAKNKIMSKLKYHPGDAPWSCVECYHGKKCVEKTILTYALSYIELQETTNNE